MKFIADAYQIWDWKRICGTFRYKVNNPGKFFCFVFLCFRLQTETIWHRRLRIVVFNVMAAAKKKKKAWLHVVSSLITLLQLVVWLLTPEYAVICGESALLICKLKSSCLYLQASRGQLAEMGADKRWVTFHDVAKFSITCVSSGFCQRSHLFVGCLHMYASIKIISQRFAHMAICYQSRPPPPPLRKCRQAAAFAKTSCRKCVFCPLGRISRTERSGRYGSDQSRDDSDWRDRRERDQERDNMRRWGDERRNDRFDDRRGSRDSPEVGSPTPGRHRIE